MRTPAAYSRLAYYLDSVTALDPESPNRFARALQLIERLAERLGMPVAVVGGLAGLHHGTGVTTLDIDVVIASGRADDFAAAAESEGLRWVNRSRNGWHRLVFSDPTGEVVIECIPAGQNSPRDPLDAPPVPEPSELGITQGLGFANLPGWTLLKLVADRDKDRYHLSEAVKSWDEAQLGSVVAHLRHYPQRYLHEFQRIVQRSRDEDPRNW